MFRRKHCKTYNLYFSNRKEVKRIDKNGEEITKISNFENTLSEGIHQNKCKYGHDDKNKKPPALNMSIAYAFLNRKILMMI